MRVLVTGGAGYIGVELVRMLLAHGDEVTVLDRMYFGREPLNPYLDRIRLIQGDIAAFDPQWLEGVDAVSHLAGLSNDPSAEYDPDANWQVNALATERLAEACRRGGVARLVFGSSASLYDGLGSGIFDERTPVRPRGAYAISKKYAEDALLANADARFSPVILRQGTVYGYSSRMRFDLVVNAFVKDAVLSGKLSLHGGGEQWRPLVDVGDVARAHVRALTAKRDVVHAEIFNVVHRNMRVRELATLVVDAFARKGKHVEVLEAPLPPLVRDYQAANAKMTERLRWTPDVTVAESIETMLASLPLDKPEIFTSPRSCNITWMTRLSS